MQNEFVGKTALIVGGGSGIGKATARMLLERGGSVIIVGRNADKLKVAEGELSQLGPVTTVQTDITNSDQLESLLVKLNGQFSDVNLMVNAAGVFFPKPFLDHTTDDYDKYFDIDKGLFFITSGWRKTWSSWAAAPSSTSARCRQSRPSKQHPLPPIRWPRPDYIHSHNILRWNLRSTRSA